MKPNASQNYVLHARLCVGFVESRSACLALKSLAEFDTTDTVVGLKLGDVASSPEDAGNLGVRELGSLSLEPREQWRGIWHTVLPLG